MTQFILTKESPEIIRFFRNISTLSKMLDDQEKNFRPVLNGERYITDSELAEKLKLTRRTLADYRMNGRLPYYKVGGKLRRRPRQWRPRIRRPPVLLRDRCLSHWTA